MTDYIYDIETFPNVFTMGVSQVDSSNRWMFVISDWHEDSMTLIDFLYMLQQTNARMVGFNNMGFDWPIVSYFQNNLPSMTNIAHQLWLKAVTIIDSDDRFGHIIWQPEIEQLDLYRINHFDNIARATSLKMLEFNMQMDEIEDLPFPVNTTLAESDVQVLIDYNLKDVEATEKFYYESLDAIRFREQLTRQYHQNFMNLNDTAIGKKYFVMELEKRNPGCCYTKDPETGKRSPRQTPRDQIPLASVVLHYIQFQHPEFKRVHQWMLSSTVKDANDIKDISAEINGFRFDFGRGGIHGSINDAIVVATPEEVIIDLDVTSYYPSIAIVNRFYPTHLGEPFCNIWAEIKAQRAQHAKGTIENKMLKLALNGSYGDLGNPYSPFYDMKCLLEITINGQLLLCMLAEQLMQIPELQLIQINTDGLTVKVPRSELLSVERVTDWWQTFTCLDLEQVEYCRMFIRDVNNYIGEDLDGKLKRKGAYEHVHPRDRNPVGWHQNLSAMVVPLAAEAYLVRGIPIRHFIENHQDFMDFMLRTKVKRSDQLEIGGKPFQRITRYLVTNYGDPIVKKSPPPTGYQIGQWKRANSLTDSTYYQILKTIDDLPRGGSGPLDSTGRPWDERINTKNHSKYEERLTGIDVGWLVTPYNVIDSPIVRSTINFEYYIQETKKLTDKLEMLV